MNKEPMIYGIATQFSRFISLEVIHPDNIVHPKKRVLDAKEAQDTIDELNRQYILDKLTGWVAQRRKALIGNGTADAMVASQLLVVIKGAANDPVQDVCRLIRSYAEQLEHLAPAKSLHNYSYFTGTIQPIIRFCKGE